MRLASSAGFGIQVRCPKPMHRQNRPALRALNSGPRHGAKCGKLTRAEIHLLPVSTRGDVSGELQMMTVFI